MKEFFLNNNSDTLILFFCGWGMDEKPFKPLKTKYDLLVLYNYSELSLNFDFSRYKTVHLLSYSYGVFTAAMLDKKLPVKPVSKTAINGTLKPIDNNYGIPQKIFDLTLGSMTLETAVKFRERLFNHQEYFRLFNKNLPLRDIDDSMHELAQLKEYFKNEVYCNYDKVLIAEEDRIIPTRNQKKYWLELQNHQNVKLIQGGHFPFYNYEFLEDLIEL